MSDEIKVYIAWGQHSNKSPIIFGVYTTKTQADHAIDLAKADVEDSLKEDFVVYAIAEMLLDHFWYGT